MVKSLRNPAFERNRSFTRFLRSVRGCEMEQLIVCAILSCYAVYVDLTAAILHSSGDIYQTGPMTVWGVIISIAAIVEVLLAFRSQLKTEIKRLKNRRHRA